MQKKALEKDKRRNNRRAKKGVISGGIGSSVKRITVFKRNKEVITNFGQGVKQIS